ncbi:uracil-DNA glycosylase [Patescibacteria group bacterium]
MNIEKHNQLQSIRKKVERLTKSPLYHYRKKNNYQPVLGEGSCDAQIVIIGEAPGKKEAETGKPFCGSAGKILDRLLDSIALLRNDVYITNIIKDRPPNNRDPKQEEIHIYAPFLDQQLSIIQPNIIATLGRFSMSYIMKHYGLEDDLAPISKIHGSIHEILSPWGKTIIIPLYHPAASIYNQKIKPDMMNDFQQIKKLLNRYKN